MSVVRKAYFAPAGGNVRSVTSIASASRSIEIQLTLATHERVARTCPRTVPTMALLPAVNTMRHNYQANGAHREHALYIIYGNTFQ